MKPKRCKGCGVFLIPEWDGDEKTTHCGYCSSKKPEFPNGYEGKEADGSRPVLRIPEDFEPLIEDYPELFDEKGQLLPEHQNWEVDWELVYEDINTLMNTLDADGTWFTSVKTINGDYRSATNFSHYKNVRDWVLKLFGRQTPDSWQIWFCGDHIEFREWSVRYAIYPSRWQAYSLTTKKYVTGRRIQRYKDHAAVKAQITQPAQWNHPEDLDRDVESYFPGEEFECHFAFDTSLKSVDVYF